MDLTNDIEQLASQIAPSNDVSQVYTFIANAEGNLGSSHRSSSTANSPENISQTQSNADEVKMKRTSDIRREFISNLGLDHGHRLSSLSLLGHEFGERHKFPASLPPPLVSQHPPSTLQGFDMRAVSALDTLPLIGFAPVSTAAQFGQFQMAMPRQDQAYMMDNSMSMELDRTLKDGGTGHFVPL